MIVHRLRQNVWLGLGISQGKTLKYLTQAGKNRDVGCRIIYSTCIFIF